MEVIREKGIGENGVMKFEVEKNTYDLNKMKNENSTNI